MIDMEKMRIRIPAFNSKRRLSNLKMLNLSQYPNISEILLPGIFQFSIPQIVMID